MSSFSLCSPGFAIIIVLVADSVFPTQPLPGRVIFIPPPPSSSHKNGLETARVLDHTNFRDFSEMTVLNHMGREYLFVVNNNSSILQLDLDSLQVLNLFRPDACTSLTTQSCQSKAKIQLISRLLFNRQSLFFFCYILLVPEFAKDSSLPTPQCVLPQATWPTSNKVYWFKHGFSSTHPSHATFLLQSTNSPEIVFIASRLQRGLSILRTQAPNLYGHIESNDDLVSATAPYYFEKESRFLAEFETSWSVFFVVVERVSATRVAGCGRQQHHRQGQESEETVEVTRLVRICKRDPGLLPDVEREGRATGAGDSDEENNKRHFGTFAKAELACDGETRGLSATWTSEKGLLVTFGGQKHGVVRTMLCGYSETAIEASFAGPTHEAWSPVHCLGGNLDSGIRTELPNLCQRLYMGSLARDSAEMAFAASMSLIGLYRTVPVTPEWPVPLLHLLGTEYIGQIHAVAIPGTMTLLVVLHSGRQTVLYTVDIAGGDACLVAVHSAVHRITAVAVSVIPAVVNQERRRQEEEKSDGDVWVFVSEGSRVVRLSVAAICAHHGASEHSCEGASAPSVCKWDGSRCVLIGGSRGRGRQRARCQGTASNVGEEKDCLVNQEALQLSCRCRILFPDNSSSGPQVKIGRCTGKLIMEPEQTELPDWGPCQLQPMKHRRRECVDQSEQCLGSATEFEKCSDPSLNDVKSNWSEWMTQQPIRLGSVKTYRQFRALCRYDNVSLVALTETRERVCLQEQDDQDCLSGAHRSASGAEEVLVWSSWSLCSAEGVRYRLRGCVSVDDCPSSLIETLLCGRPGGATVATGLKAALRSGAVMKPHVLNGDTLRFTVVHLVLAVLCVSFIWFFILILIIVIRPRIRHCQQRHLRRHLRPILAHPPKILSLPSVISNDYHFLPPCSPSLFPSTPTLTPRSHTDV